MFTNTKLAPEPSELVWLHDTLMKNCFKDWSQSIRIQAYVKHVAPGVAHFWPCGHNLNKLGRSTR